MILLTGGNGFLGKVVQDVLTLEGLDYKVLPREKFWEADKYNADGIIHMAGLCGGIQENIKRPGDFMRDNLQVGISALEMAREYHIKRFINISSACAYPEVNQPHPLLEWQMWNGRPQETHAPYGIAKRTIMEMARAYEKQHGIIGCSVVLANLYGVGVEYNGERSHVIPALVQKLTAARDMNLPSVMLMGTGKAKREFLYVDDAARAIVRIYQGYIHREDKRVPEAKGIVNVGSGEVVSIKDTAEAIREAVGYDGEILWDSSYPDGNSHREVNSDFIKAMGWLPSVDFREGIRRTVQDFRIQRVTA